MSLETILSGHFSRRQAQLFTPTSRPDLYQQQQRNTVLYYQLLSDRFMEFEKNDLALKLAMLYFDLPVEPMILPWDRFIKRIEIRPPEPAAYDVQAPLHFLTAHKERNWGREALKGIKNLS